MTVDLVRAAPRPLDFTVDGQPVFARKLPFRHALKLQDGEIDASVMAEIIYACVLLEDGSPAFTDTDDILDRDTDHMVALFNAVSQEMISSKDAEKN